MTQIGYMLNLIVCKTLALRLVLTGPGIVCLYNIQSSLYTVAFLMRSVDGLLKSGKCVPARWSSLHAATMRCITVARSMLNSEFSACNAQAKDSNSERSALFINAIRKSKCYKAAGLSQNSKN